MKKIVLVLMLFFLCFFAMRKIKFKNAAVSTNVDSVYLHENEGTSLNDIMSSGRRFCISFDDWYLTMQELISSNSPSMFSNTTMSWLKSMHEKYGVCFTLNLYTNEGSFHLYDLTNKYASEWVENKDWLKVSFHTNGASTDYNSQTASKAKSDYEEFVDDVMRFAGDTSVIDRVMRGNFFHGNSDCVNAWRDAKCGIVGLYGCDDARATHYYLSQDQTNWLNNHDRWFDNEKQLWFFKTDIRYEYLGSSTSSGTVVPAANYSNINDWLNSFLTAEKCNCASDLVVFTHENYVRQTSYKTMMENTFIWAVQHKYKFCFMMNEIQHI